MTISLHTNWRNIPAEAYGCAAALGNFDGVHLGHAHLLRSVFAARPDLPPAVVTFEPHPRELFRPQDPPFRLTLSTERLAALRALGVRHVFQIGFDKTFSELGAEQFVEDVLHNALRLHHVGCGPDFAFGHRRGGNVAFLAERTHQLGMGFTAVQALADQGGPFFLHPYPPPVAGWLSGGSRLGAWATVVYSRRCPARGQARQVAGFPHRQYSTWPPP
jgi:riboflavin kinase/FMN adenylyltransferase